MSENTPTRLPQAFIRVSKCPICKYSLRDLAVDANCPECGAAIDRDLFASSVMREAVNRTKGMCLRGALAWGLLLGLFWLISTIWTAENRISTPGTFIVSKVVLAWLISSSPVVAIGFLIHWWRNARSLIYKNTVIHEQKTLPLRRAGMLELAGAVLLVVILTGLMFSAI